MRKMIVVAVREYQAAVKTKAFIISLIAMPLFYGGMVLVQLALRDKVDITDKRIAILDQTSSIYDAVAEAARRRNETEIFRGEGPDRKQVKPRFIIERAQVTASDPARAAFELSERVRKNELFAFVVIGPDCVDPGDDPTRATINYHSNSPTYDDFQKWVAGPINNRLQELRLQAANLDPEVVRKAIRHIAVTNLGLVSMDEEGNIKEAEQSNELANFLIPFGLMMLMFMVVMVGTSPLVQSVLEEKMNRIAEVLLGSIPPFQLMMGKLIGMVGVSLTIATVYLVGAFYALHRTGYDQFFPAHLIWWFVIFQALAVLMYGSLFIAIGAAVTDMKEAQSTMMPVMLIVVMPMFVWMNVLREPLATFAVVTSLFPPATPMLMIIRQAVPPGIPLWQPLLGVALVMLTTLLFVLAAGRIFRVGILMQGRGAKLGEMMRWVIRG